MLIFLEEKKGDNNTNERLEIVDVSHSGRRHPKLKKKKKKKSQNFLFLYSFYSLGHSRDSQLNTHTKHTTPVFCFV